MAAMVGAMRGKGVVPAAAALQLGLLLLPSSSSPLGGGGGGGGIGPQMAYAAGAYEGGSGSVSNQWNALMVLTIGGVLVLQFLTRQLDALVRHKRHMREMVESIYKELTILGIIAFALFAISDYSSIKLNPTDKHLFEIIHFTLFLSAMFYALLILVIVVLSRQISRCWDLYEQIDVRRYKTLKAHHRTTAEQMGIMTRQEIEQMNIFRVLFLIVRHPKLYRRWRELADHVSYHELRLHFIKVMGLPANFHFATYLKKCKQHVALDLVEVHEGVWVALAWVLTLDMYIKGLIPAYEGSFRWLALFSLCGCVVVVATLAIYAKMAHIYNNFVNGEILHGPVTGSGEVDMAVVSDGVMSQKRMFWFGKPELVISGLQFLQFVLALNVALLVQFSGDLGKTELAVSVFSILFSLATYFLTLPQVIPAFTMVTHVGDMVDRRRISEALAKQQRKFHVRAVPPTLKQATRLAQWRNDAVPIKERIAQFLRHPYTVEAVNLLVVLDFFIIAFNTDTVKNQDDEYGGLNDNWIFYTEVALVSLFVLEAALTVYVTGFCNVLLFRDKLVSIDILVVLVSAVMLVLTVILKGVSQSAVHAAGAVVLLRVLRLSRVLRVIRNTTEENYGNSGSKHQHDGEEIGRPLTRKEREETLEETKRLLIRQNEGLLPPADAGEKLADSEQGGAYLLGGEQAVKEYDPTRLEGDFKAGDGTDEYLPRPERAGMSFATAAGGAAVGDMQNEAIEEGRLAVAVADAEAVRHGRDLSGASHSRSVFGMFKKKPNAPASTIVSMLEGMELSEDEEYRVLAHHIWEKTCTKFPDVVAVNGRLSLPILELMLGVKSVDNGGGQVTSLSSHVGSGSRHARQPRHFRNLNGPSHRRASTVASPTSEMERAGWGKGVVGGGHRGGGDVEYSTTGSGRALTEGQQEQREQQQVHLDRLLARQKSVQNRSTSFNNFGEEAEVANDAFDGRAGGSSALKHHTTAGHSANRRGSSMIRSLNASLHDNRRNSFIEVDRKAMMEEPIFSDYQRRGGGARQQAPLEASKAKHSVSVPAGLASKATPASPAPLPEKWGEPAVAVATGPPAVAVQQAQGGDWAMGHGVELGGGGGGGVDSPMRALSGAGVEQQHFDNTEEARAGSADGAASGTGGHPPVRLSGVEEGDEASLQRTESARFSASGSGRGSDGQTGGE